MPRQMSKSSRDLNLNSGELKSINVNIQEGQLIAIDELAWKIGVSRDALLRYALGYFSQQHKAGLVTIKLEKLH